LAPPRPRPPPRAEEKPTLHLHGVGCQIRRQAGHGAAHSLATSLEAAEFIPRLAAVNVGTFF